MNRGYYPKLLGQYKAFFEGNYEQERPFSCKINLKEMTQSWDEKMRIKCGMVSENERNELGDVASVNTEGSFLKLNYFYNNRQCKLKLRENRISGRYQITPGQKLASEVYYSRHRKNKPAEVEKKYTHSFGAEFDFEPKLLWNFYGSDKWNLFAHGQYNKVCYNQLRVGFQGETGEDNKLDSLKPNKISFNNATILQQGFFLGGQLDFLIKEKKPENFEKVIGYADETKIAFAKHVSKGFANEEGQAEVGALGFVKHDKYTDELGVGVTYKIQEKESVVRAGVGRFYEDSKVHVKAKVENTTAFVSVGLKVTNSLRLELSDSIDIVAYAKNPKDGDSHKYKMGVSLIYTDIF